MKTAVLNTQHNIKGAKEANMVTSNVVDGKIQDSDSYSNVSSLNKNTKKNNSDLDVNDFLKLLAAQMQYQDPLEPTDNTQYIAQMATFTQVSATTSMNERVQQQTASNLVGKYVIVQSGIDATQLVAGKVQSWEKIDGTIYLRIDDKLYDIDDLDRVLDDDYYKKLLQGSTTGGTTDSGSTTGSTTGTDNKTESTDKTEDKTESSEA